MNELLKQIKYNRTPYADLVEILTCLSLLDDNKYIATYGIGDIIYFRYLKNHRDLKCHRVFEKTISDVLSVLIMTHTNLFDLHECKTMSIFYI